MLYMDSFMSQETPSLRSRESGVNPNAPAIGGRYNFRVWSVPNNCYVRQRAQHAPYILHKFEYMFESVFRPKRTYREARTFEEAAEGLLFPVKAIELVSDLIHLCVCGIKFGHQNQHG